jgi:glycosyltransferase involved in cell wall biosynthesis
MNSSVFIVVPVFNEGPVIASSLDMLIKEGYSIVCVDDASTDNSLEVIRSLPVHSLHHRVNLGQGASIQTGMTYAIERAARYIVHFDADGQHNPADIPSLLAPLENGEADVVLGSRFIRDEDRAAVPPAKRALLKAGVVVNWTLTGVKLTDAHNGFRAMTADAARKLNLRENRFAHASEILDEIRRNKLRVVERPTAIAYTDYSTAKGQSMWNSIKIVTDMLLRRIFR